MSMVRALIVILLVTLSGCLLPWSPDPVQGPPDIEPYFNIGYSYWWSISEQEKAIYINHARGKVIALNLDLTTKWEFSTPEWAEQNNMTITVPPVIGTDGTLYITTEKKVYALDPQGNQKWVYSSRYMGNYNKPLLLSDGTLVYLVNKMVLGIAPDGTEKWSYSLGDYQVTSIPKITVEKDQNIYVQLKKRTADQQYREYTELYVLNPQGEIRWKLEINYHDVYFTIMPDGAVYFISGQVVDYDRSIYSYALYAYDSCGQIKWTYPLKENGYRYGNNFLTIGDDGTVYVMDSNITALKPDGAVKWTTSEIYSATSCFFLIDGNIYGFTDKDFNVYDLDGSIVLSKNGYFTHVNAVIYLNGFFYLTQSDESQREYKPYKMTLGGEMQEIPFLPSTLDHYSGTVRKDGSTVFSQDEARYEGLDFPTFYSRLHIINADGTERWSSNEYGLFNYCVLSDGKIYIQGNYYLYLVEK